MKWSISVCCDCGSEMVMESIDDRTFETHPEFIGRDCDCWIKHVRLEPSNDIEDGNVLLVWGEIRLWK